MRKDLKEKNCISIIYLHRSWVSAIMGDPQAHVILQGKATDGGIDYCPTIYQPELTFLPFSLCTPLTLVLLIVSSLVLVIRRIFDFPDHSSTSFWQKATKGSKAWMNSKVWQLSIQFFFHPKTRVEVEKSVKHHGFLLTYPSVQSAITAEPAHLKGKTDWK